MTVGVGLEGELHPSFSAWTSASIIYLAGSRLSGTIGHFCGCNALSFLSVASSTVSGELPDCLASLPLYNINMASTRITRVSPLLARMPSMNVLDVSYSRVAFRPEDCPGAGGVVRAQTLSYSGNPWNVSLQTALTCLAGTSFANSTLQRLLMDGMGLTGTLAPGLGLPDVSGLRELSLANNDITADTSQSAPYGLTNLLLAKLVLRGNRRLGAPFNIDAGLIINELDIRWGAGEPDQLAPGVAGG